MRFRNFPDTALGSKVKVRILMYMLSEGAPTSERELSRILGVSHMAVNKSMKDFHDINLVSPIRIGNVISWKLKKDSYAYHAITNLIYMAKTPPIEELKVRIREIPLFSDLPRVVILGSVAEGREEPDSDIDLLVITRDTKQKETAIKKLSELSEFSIKRYGNRLSLYIITEQESRRPANRKIISSANNGIVIS